MKAGKVPWYSSGTKEIHSRRICTAIKRTTKPWSLLYWSESIQVNRQQSTLFYEIKNRNKEEKERSQDRFRWFWATQFDLENMEIDYGKICDFLIFFGFLIGSTLFPLWGSLLRKKNAANQSDTKANYVFATGQVGIFAMMLSIARGTLGVRAFLGKLWILCHFEMWLRYHDRIVQSIFWSS